MTDDLTAPSLIEGMTRLVSQAGAEIMRIRSGPLTSRLKDDRSPVTLADEASEAVILEGLSRLLPGVPVISEEAASQGEVAAAGETFLLVDPLDGTREFMAARDEFTINVAVVRGRRPIAGILAAPARGQIWRGVVGRGAESLSLPAGADPRGARTQPIGARRFANPPVALVSRSHLDPKTEALLAKWPNVEKKSCGSALKFALLAEGTADLYPRLAPTSEWDIAAGDAIVTAAGGVVRDPDGAPIAYGGNNGGFIIPAFIGWGDPAAAGEN